MGLYEGEYKDGKYHCQGTLILSDDGQRYAGEWKYVKRNGQETFTWPSGQKYEWNFKDGLSDGQGTLTLANGTKFEGEWKDDRKRSRSIHLS